MNTTTIENAIITLLKASILKTHIESFPDDFLNYNLSRVNTILVSFKNLERDTDLTTFFKRPQNRLTFRIFAFSQNRRSTKGHEGGYGLLYQIWKTLENQSIEGGEIYRVSESLAKRDEKTGLWIFVADYKLLRTYDVEKD